MEVKNNYTNDELIERIWDTEEVRKIMNLHSYYNSNEMRREELTKLWVKKAENRRTASLAYNNGFFIGMDEIIRQYVLFRDEQRYAQLEPYCASEEKLAYASENLGFGCSVMNTLTTPLIYLADDGQSARFQGYRLGYQAKGRPDGAEAYFDFGLVRADLLKEDGVWKIWHLDLEHDHTVEVATNYRNVPIYLKPEDDPLTADFGSPTMERSVYDPFYGWEYMWEDMPKPYYTYSDSDSYGPNGNLGKAYYERERR